MTLDEIIHAKKYNYDTYNCFHFVCEMHERLTGIPMNAETILRSLRGGGFSDLRGFKRLRKPKDGAVCFFHDNCNEPHIGLFYKGKVLHLGRNGARHQALHLALLGFRTVSFYDYTDNN